MIHPKNIMKNSHYLKTYIRNHHFHLYVGSLLHGDLLFFAWPKICTVSHILSVATPFHVYLNVIA